MELTSLFLCQMFVHLAHRITGMGKCHSCFRIKAFRCFFSLTCKTLLGLEMTKNDVAERLAMNASLPTEMLS